MKANTKTLYGIAALTGALLLTAPALAQDDEGDGAAACYTVSGESRYQALGYSHVVTVTNRCDAALQCAVWTDVDPKKRSVSVAPNSSSEVVLRVGSPAREFKAQGTCE